MSEYETSDGLEVTVTAMHAYPDGLLLGAELAALALPAVGGLPQGVLDQVKAAISGDGDVSARVATLSVLGSLALSNPAEGGVHGSAAAALFDGLARALTQIADRKRFLRISEPLLATLSVRHEGKQVELADVERVRRVVGSNIRLLAELLGIALRGNFASFFSGVGGTSDASATGAPASR